MAKSKQYIFKHQYVHNPRHMSSDTITVPDLVLSMRDVYKKYVMFGTVEGLAVNPLVQDDRLMDDFPEETTDSLLLASDMRERALHELEEKNKKPEDKPEDKPEVIPVDQPDDEHRDIPKD